MTLRITRDADFAHAAFGKHAAGEQGDAVLERARRLRVVPAYEKDLSNAGFVDGAPGEGLEFCA